MKEEINAMINSLDPDDSNSWNSTKESIVPIKTLPREPE